MKNFRENIDFLKGIAILGVVSVHFSQCMGKILPLQLKYILSLGANGVQLFFLVSSITLAHSMVIRSNSESRPIVSFYLRRLFRIAPLYYLAIFYYVIFDQSWTISWRSDDAIIPEICQNVLFVHGYFPSAFNSIVPGGWSIGVEMSFYLIFPLIFKFFNYQASRIYLLIFLSLVIKASLYILISQLAFNESWILSEFLHMYLPSQIPYFLLGIILYHSLFFDKKKNENWNLIFIISLIGLFIIDFGLLNSVIFQKEFIVVLCFFVFSYGLLKNDLEISHLKFINILGRYSYGIYIVHFTVLGVVPMVPVFYRNSLLIAILIFISVVLISLFIAIIIYSIYEKPMISLGKKIIGKLNKPQDNPPCAA